MNRIKQYLLFCPGPVNIAQNIWPAMVQQVGHREQEFSELLAAINQHLLSLYEIKQKSKYFSVLITGSATAANEAILSSIVGDKHILILSNGEFGERLHSISRLHNNNTHLLQFGWGEKIDIKKVERYLTHKSVDIVALVHHETSTGMLNSIEDIGLLTKKYKKTFFVDTVSSVGSDMIDLEKSNIIFCSASSGKGISALPGIGIVIGEKRAFEELKNTPAKTMYLNLYKLYEYAKTHEQTPNTPAVHLFYALDQALTNILRVGVEKWRNKNYERAIMVREGLHKLGLAFLLDEQDMSASLTTVMTPPHISFSHLRQVLRKRRIVIYNGKGPLKNKVFQVATMGTLEKSHIIYFLHSLEDTLVQLGYEYPREKLSSLLHAFATLLNFSFNHLRS